jgi:glycosyltransferase involved in cell wall biosynthesis
VITVWGTDLVKGDRPAGGLKRLLNRWVLRRAAAVTAASRFLGDSAVAIGVPPARVHTVPFGVDTERFTPASSEASGFVVGYVKGLHRRYDPSTLIAAFDRLSSTAPAARLVIAGEGPLRRELEELVASLGLVDRVEFLGIVPHDRVPELMHQFHVLVNPSRSESFGVVLLEAAASGIPVVAAKVGGVPEVVDHGATGLLFEVGDVEGMAAALLRLSADPQLRHRLGTAGRTRVVSDYRWEECVDEMVRVLKSAVS